MVLPKDRNQSPKEREKRVLNRRRLSRDTRVELADEIENDNWEAAFSIVFEVLTGEEYTDYVGDSR